MNYIQPNTTLKLLADVPLKNDYHDSKYCSSADEQFNSFNSKCFATIEYMTYQNYAENVISVELGKYPELMNMKDALKCNYIMFKNSSHENKWFYAFVTKIEYVNEKCVKYTYEIDEIQTWYFESHYNECFIEREHTATDNYYEHLIPEDMPAGDYVQGHTQEVAELSNHWVICVALSENSEEKTGGKLINGIYSGLTIIYYELDDIDTPDGLNDFLSKTVEAGKQDTIVSIYMCPYEFIAVESEEPYEIDFKFAVERASLNGYIPKNKKLFNYPYCAIYATNLQGNDAVYQPELIEFTDDGYGLQGKVLCDGLPGCSAYFVPMYYKNSGINKNWKEMLSSAPYPLCSWTTDYYQAWLVQNAVPNNGQINNAIGQMVQEVTYAGLGGAIFAGGVATGGAPGLIGMMSGISTGGQAIGNTIASTTSISNAINSMKVAQKMANPINGNINGNLLASARKIGFIFYSLTINKDLAKSYDDYLTVFGYKVNTVKRPNPANRPYYTYIKTIGCNMSGDVPSESLDIQNKAHDAGITFWRNLDDVGNYSLDNSV